MEMSFKQYIDNPMGKRNAVFSQRDMFKKLYTEKFDKLILREAGKINFALYIDKKKDRYVAHIKIPSETVKNFYYDAVILFYATDAAVKSSSTLLDYSVKFFSNDPAFVFTYLRVFLKNNLFFEDLKPKSSKLALKKDPKERNPYEVPGYSKILYFAYLFMRSKNLFSKSMFETYAESYSAKKLLNNVEHTDKKISDRQEFGEKAAREKAREKQKERKEANKARINNSSSDNVKISKPITTSRNVSKTGVVKRTPTVKTAKRIK